MRPVAHTGNQQCLVARSMPRIFFPDCFQECLVSSKRPSFFVTRKSIQSGISYIPLTNLQSNFIATVPNFHWQIAKIPHVQNRWVTGQSLVSAKWKRPSFAKRKPTLFRRWRKTKIKTFFCCALSDTHIPRNGHVSSLYIESLFSHSRNSSEH